MASFHAGAWVGFHPLSQASCWVAAFQTGWFVAVGAGVRLRGRMGLLMGLALAAAMAPGSGSLRLGREMSFVEVPGAAVAAGRATGDGVMAASGFVTEGEDMVKT